MEDTVDEELLPYVNWWHRASCHGLHDDFDFEVYGMNQTMYAGKVKVLRRICESCPVKQECFDDAMEHSDEFTFRAGMTPAERKRYMNAHGILSWREKNPDLFRQYERKAKNGN